MRKTFTHESFISLPARIVFELHERPDAFEMLTPPGFEVEIHSTASTLRPSTDVVRFTKRVAGILFRFAMIHTVYEKPRLFVDEQLEGPFSYWQHRHQFIEAGWGGDPATLLKDEIVIGHPLFPLASFAVTRPLASLFRARHDITKEALAEPLKAERPFGRKEVALTGGTGLIGRRIAEILLERGDSVLMFARDEKKVREMYGDSVQFVEWNFHHPERGTWRDALGRADAVIHLAGTPLFSRRWNQAFKKEMKESRTQGTRQLVQAIAEASPRPRTFLSASAVGIYGTDPSRLVTESSDHGSDLLADICIDWESEARRAEEAGLRTVQLRFGVVLDRSSGALGEMLPLFLLFGGGVMGSPRSWINWIHLEDAVRIVLMALDNEAISGPINVTAPHPVPNRTFAHTLAHVLRRPCLMRYPETLLRLAIGEAAAYASGGPRVLSDLAREHGYSFFFDDLEDALRNILRRPR